MRALRLLVAFVVVIALGGCTTHDALMPNVLGSHLDVAKSDIKRAGFKGNVEVLGGGVFGILDESNWMVCEQLPGAGQVVTDSPRLKVDRSCPGVASEPSASSPPTDQSTAPESSEPSSAPSSTAAAQEDSEDADVEDSQEADGEDSDTDETPSISAAAIEKKFKEHLRNNGIKKISDMCDKSFTHWACFYDGVEDGAGYLVVKLTTDGGWSDAALEKLADKAGRHWFNFIGCDFPDLDTIVVNINGLDYNEFRADTAVDSMCD